MIEAIEKIERLAKKRLDVSFSPETRMGDHKWYVSDVRKFTRHYPGWRLTIGIDEILDEMVAREKKPER
jgi:CDP-paratose 2-epimerase